MSVFIVVVVSLGGLVVILPLIFQDQVRTPAAPNTAAQITPAPHAAKLNTDIEALDADLHGLARARSRP